MTTAHTFTASEEESIMQEFIADGLEPPFPCEMCDSAILGDECHGCHVSYCNPCAAQIGTFCKHCAKFWCSDCMYYSDFVRCHMLKCTTIFDHAACWDCVKTGKETNSIHHCACRDAHVICSGCFDQLTNIPVPIEDNCLFRVKNSLCCQWCGNKKNGTKNAPG